ncbi:MAG: LuxR C-terminal-related transcriptional regulator [Microbacterium sp.]|jgi:non-specific serine/threonine protein kinase|uniref:ATP-binding protein n=1 Tax=Microbacterium sp. TaxID=51671 RepID=UPI00283A0857|nr:LuxR C-terminal-related transcriptional regulator [Microbacterium sp.]MDR2323258.1 LuxR C-terminal-related transcriptional regulator [Microbacterium sp.]
MIREPRSAFVGRGRELDALSALLRDARLVTLTGVGGAGKTRLAIRAANAYADATGDAVWFVPLDGLQDPRRLPEAVARALPLGEQSARDPREFVVDVLGETPGLLVLDNCEHLVDAVAAMVDELLDAVPGLRIAATSRRRLELDGEQVFAVPPLQVQAPPGDVSEAVALLTARARAADSSFALRPEDAPIAEEICRALDGLPLAIELAASRLRTLSPAELAARLSARFTLLRGSSRSSVARQRTLRAVVDWSHDLCSPPQRALWAAVSTFSGPFDLAAAAAVAGEPEEATLDLLDELVAQSLVEADRDAGRFRLLETIRGYGRERAEESGARPVLVRRHLAHYARVAAEAERHWYGPRQAEIVAGLRADRAELQASLRAAAALDTAAALRLFADLRYHWGVGGYLREGRAWAARLLPAPEAPPALRVPALLTATWLCLLQGDLAEARIRLDEAAALSEALPAEVLSRTEIERHRWNGTLALFSGDPAHARDEFARSIRLAVKAGRPEESMFARFQLTTAMSHLGLPDAALPAASAERQAAEIGERWMRSLALWARALASFTDGALDDAERIAKEALAVDTGIDDPAGDCLVLELLAWIDAARSRPERAALLLGAARSRWRRIGSGIEVHGPQMTAHHDRCVEILRARLGRRAAERLTARGEHLSPAEAVSFDEHDAARTPALSDREREVAAGIHAGLSNRGIAAHLVLSVRTIDTHVQRIFAKLGVSSRAQIAAWYEADSAGSNR